MNFSIPISKTLLAGLILTHFTACSVFKKNEWKQPNYPLESQIKVIKKTSHLVDKDKVIIMGFGFFLDGGDPAVGATISTNSTHGTMIGLEGDFQLECEPGELKLLAKFIGYHNGELQINTEGGEVIELKIEFSPSATTLDN